MQRLPSRGKNFRPTPLETKSFQRLSPSPDPPTSRSRSSTLPGPGPSHLNPLPVPLGIVDLAPDPFETHDAEISSPTSEQGPEAPFPEGYDELPIEIQSLLERYGLAYFVIAETVLMITIGSLNLYQLRFIRHHSPSTAFLSSSKSSILLRNLISQLT